VSSEDEPSTVNANAEFLDHIGTEGSYQMLADQVGDDSYNYENFLPYFQKSQNFTPPDRSRRLANATPSYDISVLGRNGKLSVIFPNYAAAFGTWIEKGLAAIGIRSIDGFQSGKLIGSAYALATIKYDQNVRESSETAFLESPLSEVDPNLIVFPSTM
jgi:choline dehydrogenase